ncbi:MAG: helix-turn-helix domain-containing protein [Desulfosalsimonadaceae bacterium]
MNADRFKPEVSISFGRYIKAIREQKGIRLSDVAESLKVSLHKLSLIESEDHQELPDAIYVKGMLRAYADFIGIDPADLIDRYEISRAAYEAESPAYGKKGPGWGKVLPRMILALLLLAGICTLSIAGFYYWSRLPAFDSVPDSGSGPAAEKAADQLSPKAKSLPPKQADRGKLVLVIDAVEKTWIKINIDGEEPLEYLLRPKDHVELEADSHYSMVIGNAAGLQMQLNGTPVEIPGKSGDVVAIELPGSAGENR